MGMKMKAKRPSEHLAREILEVLRREDAKWKRVQHRMHNGMRWSSNHASTAGSVSEYLFRMLEE